MEELSDSGASLGKLEQPFQAPLRPERARAAISSAADCGSGRARAVRAPMQLWAGWSDMSRGEYPGKPPTPKEQCFRNPKSTTANLKARTKLCEQIHSLGGCLCRMYLLIPWSGLDKHETQGRTSLSISFTAVIFEDWDAIWELLPQRIGDPEHSMFWVGTGRATQNMPCSGSPQVGRPRTWHVLGRQRSGDPEHAMF